MSESESEDTHDLFAVEHSPGKRYEISVGEYFIQNDKEWAKEAVIGDFAAPFAPDFSFPSLHMVCDLD